MTTHTQTTDSPISAKAEAQARSGASRTRSTVSEHRSGNDGIGRNRQSQSGVPAAQGEAVPAGAQRGSILVYSLLTMASMLAMSLTLNALFISKFRLAAASRNATTALYAADSAVEMCLYEARTGVDDNPLLLLENGATFTIVNVAAAPGDPPITDDCSILGGSFGFRATGLYRGTSRALEISQ